ncbi:hypothetical protein SELMODRAFT_91736 [Selaginella moellendorffii]|uniref:EXPERA domain-containing protein n=1 Tax=Selaginella moellendorffii TaxID=88036 RepID=D8RE75_SELML|nr:sigma intracellular receptor 2 [Selaginella moellendorffii]EFJ29615.1 hypothetical protein SELMODRAFT_91736 [Selaginella moellendorffii]|eukprot:XP_002969527.1 sigma intracellular receptor 2 [Selaginella moellendorffii]
MRKCRGSRGLDVGLAIFFALNVPLVLFVDSTAVLPMSCFPAAIQALVRWHIRTSGDYLMRDKPPFFLGLVFCEIFVQLPLYIANAIAFYYGKPWGRTTGIIYGVHTATTMIPILFDILCSQVPTKFQLFSIYVPYLIIPLIVLVRLMPYTYPFAKKRIE